MKYVRVILCSVVSNIQPRFKFLCKNTSLCISLAYKFFSPLINSKYILNYCFKIMHFNYNR